jgi:hypothetical protein
MEDLTISITLDGDSVENWCENYGLTREELASKFEDFIYEWCLGNEDRDGSSFDCYLDSFCH